jgi:hypothetical protein
MATDTTGKPFVSRFDVMLLAYQGHPAGGNYKGKRRDS